jgi:alpha-beta hydrolase superfamily lysophospholipase
MTFRLTSLIAVSALAAAALASPANAAPRQELSVKHCVERTVDVRLTDSGPADNQIWGQLCWRGERVPSAVQLLVPGTTYDHNYWDFPYQAPRYSYVDAATRAGFATFNIDRVGTGHSSHPLSSLVSISAEVIALHDVVTALRSGAVSGRPFATIQWVGHSLGSIIGAYEVSTYHDVDAYLATGMLHAINIEWFTETGGTVYPANQDPAFAALGLDDGYTTTLPGTRSRFYDAGTVAQGVLDTEETTKSYAPGQFPVELPPLLLPASPELSPTYQIDVPVLLVDGQDDHNWCGEGYVDCSSSASVLAYETPYFAPAAQLQAVVIPGTGHAVSLSTTNTTAYAAMLAWAGSKI